MRRLLLVLLTLLFSLCGPAIGAISDFWQPFLAAKRGGFTGAGFSAYDDAAEAAYASIRGTRCDVAQIAQNLGLDASAVNTMKKHLFYGATRLQWDPERRFLGGSLGMRTSPPIGKVLRQEP